MSITFLIDSEVTIAIIRIEQSVPYDPPEN